MDPKSGSQTNNGVKHHGDLAKLPSKSKTNDANTSSKQIAEPKQRVIKQIVSLDPKKLKALGIESNILSALTKFNGKDKASIKTKQPTVTVTVTNTEPSTSTIESPARKSIISAAISSSSVKPIIALTGCSAPAHKKPDETSTAKKIQVLSNVLLSENKLDLKIFPVITSPSSSSSSSTPKVSHKHISYVSPVPRPSQIKRVNTDKVPSSQVSSPVVVHQEKVDSTTVTENRADNRTQSESPVKSPTRSPVKSPVRLPIKSPEKSPITTVQKPKSPLKSPSLVKKHTKSPVKQPDSELSPKTNEIDSLKGFSLPELKCSQNQFENLQHEVHTNPSTVSAVEVEQEKDISTVEVEQNEETENVEETSQTESTIAINSGGGNGTEPSSTFSTSETIPSDQSSDSESDLDELILEAQITIENEREVVDTDETEDSPEPKIAPKKPRLVQKKFLDMLTEHVDKDRLIDDFLVSTSNSFHTNDISDSDSNDDHDNFDMDVDVDVDVNTESIAEINDTENVREESEKVTVEANVEPSDGDISTTETTDILIQKVADTDISRAELVDTNILATELVDESKPAKDLAKCEKAIEDPSPPAGRKRKICANSEISSKRKKSTLISDDKIKSTAMQTQDITTKTIVEPKIVETPLEIIQEASEVESTSNLLEPEQQQSIVVNIGGHSKSLASKRGKKPKQTILNDYFAVQNSIRDATKQALDEVINSVSTKRSRSGRVIKPKSFDIETKSTAKPKRKTRKELTNEREPEPEPMIVPEIEVKTESIAPKPLKKRRDKRGNYVIPDDIPSIDTLSDSTIKPIAESTVSRATEAEPSLVSSTPIIEKPTARRKSTKETKSQSIEPIPGSPSYDNISIEIETPKMVPKRKGRPPKKSLIPNETLSQISAIDSNVSIEHAEVTMKQEECTETPTKVIPKKRRGRTRKIAVIDDENVSSSDDMPVMSLEDHFKTPQETGTHRRRRRPASKSDSVDEYQTPPSTSESIPISAPTEDPTPTENSIGDADSHSLEPIIKKRGRPRVKPKPAIEKIVNPIKLTCGNCQAEIPKNKWKAHEATHLGVTFRVGLDEPFDVEDPSNMGRLMIRYMKYNKIQYLKCPKCGEKKRSALGYISHVELCGLSEEEVTSLKAECEFCKKLYRKVSLPSHQQGFCPVRRLELAQQQADQMVETAAQDEENIEVIYSESGRPKRMIKKVKPTSKPVDDFIKVGLKITGGTYKSWSNQLREENIIKCTNENCTFSVTDLKEMRRHFIKCRESILQCKICLQTERSRNAIVEHIETTHPDELKLSEVEEDDNDDDDDFKAGNSSSDSSYGDSGDDEHEPRRNKSIHRKRSVPLKRIMEEDSPAYWEMLSAFYTRILNSRPGFHRKSYQWAKEFVEQNYDLNALTLTGHMRSTYEIVRLPQREVNKFLGLLQSRSVKFLCQKQTEYQQAKSEVIDGNWSNLNLFECVKSTHVTTEPTTIFCGGKIITADWIPFPSEYNGTQILAICAQGQGTHPINATNSIPMTKCRSLIQLWSVSTNADRQIDKTEFMYGIAYEDGPICSTSFCPSDAYVASKRLAIVALPNTIGNINIISIPDNVSRAKTNTPTVIKLKPEIRLQLGWNNDENPAHTVTQMVWSRTKGHKVLCAGYNSGLIAVWNFDHLNSTYLTQKGSSDGITVLLPQCSFMASLSLITQLDLHSDDNGNARWILVGALDRRMRLFDLQDPQLVPFTSTVFKSRIISGTWPLHWPIYLTIIDAVLTRQNGGLHIKPILYTNNQSSNSTLFNDCEPSNLTFSDWLNTGIFGNEIGDLFMINFQQLLVYDRYDESSEQKVLSSTDVFVDEQSSSAVSNDRISILFKDCEDKVLSPKLNTRGPEVDQPPNARITRVAINPNESHQKLYAAGYELGFCRIHFIPGTIG
ncbi:uncharacterized protein LOC129576508 [Sitodiplosis mosellana]|uniref:uncharacterized protein LOC129576508 n=1 Tax=Sitodiplosis mosellana TaxID=263140 RepID=UPI002445018C|nr:uncharacterized protein LOC129576508 [Sitodiplosis mosellana]